LRTEREEIYTAVRGPVPGHVIILHPAGFVQCNRDLPYRMQPSILEPSMPVRTLFRIVTSNFSASGRLGSIAHWDGQYLPWDKSDCPGTHVCVWAGEGFQDDKGSRTLASQLAHTFD
jgi:hypothetical protein